MEVLLIKVSYSDSYIIIFLHDVGTMVFLPCSTMLGWCECKAVQGIVGNVGCPWESLVLPTGNGEAGNASLPNKTAEQKIWRRRADWTIGQCREEEKKTRTHTSTRYCSHSVKVTLVLFKITRRTLRRLESERPEITLYLYAYNANVR